MDSNAYNQETTTIGSGSTNSRPINMPLAYGNLEGLSATLNLLGEAVNGLSLRLLPVSSPPDEPFSEKPDKDRIPMSDISNRILDAQEQAHRILENVQAIEHRLEV